VVVLLLGVAVLPEGVAGLFLEGRATQMGFLTVLAVAVGVLVLLVVTHLEQLPVTEETVSLVH